MRLYIDKENLLSFISAAKDPAVYDLVSDCRKMMKKHMSLCYNFSKKAVREDPALQAWFMGYGTQGCGRTEPDVFLEEKYPPRPVKCNFCTQLSRPECNAVYLIAEDVTKVCNMHSVLAGGVGDELSVLGKLMCDDDYQFHKLYNIREREVFSGWDQLDSDGHILPTADILIIDRYLFGGRNDIQEIVLEHNLYKFLEIFGSKRGSRVNVVFLTSGVRNKPLWAARKSRIEKCLKKHNKHAVVNVTFIFYPLGIHEDVIREHDRLIVTNYRLFRSGDSFVYYNSNGDLISNGQFLDVDSTADSDKSRQIESILTYVQQTYNAIRDLRNDDLIIGDKVSSFIDF